MKIKNFNEWCDASVNEGLVKSEIEQTRDNIKNYIQRAIGWINGSLDDRDFRHIAIIAGMPGAGKSVLVRNELKRYRLVEGKDYTMYSAPNGESVVELFEREQNHIFVIDEVDFDDRYMMKSIIENSRNNVFVLITNEDLNSENQSKTIMPMRARAEVFSF